MNRGEKNRPGGRFLIEGTRLTRNAATAAANGATLGLHGGEIGWRLRVDAAAIAVRTELFIETLFLFSTLLEKTHDFDDSDLAIHSKLPSFPFLKERSQHEL